MHILPIIYPILCIFIDFEIKEFLGLKTGFLFSNYLKWSDKILFIIKVSD